MRIPQKQSALVWSLWRCLRLFAQGHVIKDIRLEGISRTEAGTVFSHLPIRVGDTYTPELGAEALRSLYAFRDVPRHRAGYGRQCVSCSYSGTSYCCGYCYNRHFGIR